MRFKMLKQSGNWDAWWSLHPYNRPFRKEHSFYDCLYKVQLSLLIWLVSQTTCIQYCLLIWFSFYRARFTHVISSNLRCNLMSSTIINLLDNLKKKLMQTYDHHKSLHGSIPNVSTVHLNGISHLIWRHPSKPVLHCRWTSCIKQTLEHSAPARVSAYTGFTVCFRVQNKQRTFQPNTPIHSFFLRKLSAIFLLKLVHACCCLPKSQAVKLTFLAP